MAASARSAYWEIPDDRIASAGFLGWLGLVTTEVVFALRRRMDRHRDRAHPSPLIGGALLTPGGTLPE